MTTEQRRNDMATYVQKKKELAQMKEEFGTKAKTVLAFHHQWLYGATALAIAHNFLKFSKPRSESHDEYSNPFHKGFYITAAEIVSFTKHLLSIHRKIEGFAGRESGYENFTYLNTPDEEPEIREDCTRGDNNDGITIIDATTGKYCFMNIQEKGYGISEILPSLIPLTANQYLKYYYPENLKDESKDERKSFKKLSFEERQKKNEQYDKNVTIHQKAKELFNDFELLSLEELAEIFPKVFNKKKLKKTELA